MISRIANPEIAIVGGVLSGLAYRIGLPTWMLRVAFIVSLFFTLSLSFIVYLVLWVIMPPKYISKEEFDVGVGMHPENSSVDIKKEE